MLVLGGVQNAVVCIILGATPVFPRNRAFRWFLYYNCGWAQASNSMFWAWTQDTLAGDPGLRAWGSAGLNVWAWTAIATIPLGAFKTTDQPAVIVGNYTAAGFLFLLAATAIALAYLQHQRALKNPGYEVGDSAGRTEREDFGIFEESTAKSPPVIVSKV
jgi:ACS family pantothenate transporter-like MFS transporter